MSGVASLFYFEKKVAFLNILYYNIKLLKRGGYYMKGVIKIKFGKEQESYELLSVGYYDCDYSFMINLTSWKSYKDIVNSKKKNH